MAMRASHQISHPEPRSASKWNCSISINHKTSQVAAGAMKLEGRRITLSATDLARHLACRHLTTLDLRAARGEIQRLFRNDPGLDALVERGLRHEAEYLAHLRTMGLTVSEQPTLEAMRSGADVIVQAELQNSHWFGRADVLLRVDTPSDLGNWS